MWRPLLYALLYPELGTPRSNISKTHIEYRLDRYGKDAGVDEELKKLKYVEVFKKTGWSHDLVQKIVDILEENHRQD